MPPTPGREWAVAQFKIDNMYSNDNHRRVIDPKQQYKGFYFTLNGDVKPDSFLELAWVIVWRGEDAQKPSPPKELALKREGDKARLSWSASKDNLKVRHYEVLRKEKDGEDWKALTIATGLSFEADAAGFPQGKYAVRAVDVAGNVSPVSNVVK